MSDTTSQDGSLPMLLRILRARVYDVAIESPLDPAPNLSRRLENTVLLKREDLQPVFSFKLRGAYNKMAGLGRAELERWLAEPVEAPQLRDPLLLKLVFAAAVVAKGPYTPPAWSPCWSATDGIPRLPATRAATRPGGFTSLNSTSTSGSDSSRSLS